MIDFKTFFESKYWGKRGAGIIIQSETTGRFLLGLRSNSVNEPNTWNLFGGKIDEGEDPKEAVLREMREEIGIKNLPEITPLDVYKDGDFSFFIYYGKVDMEFKPRLNSEHSDAKWFSINKFPNNLHFGLKRLVPKLRQLS